MKINEKSNSLMIKMEHGDNLFEIVGQIIKKYRITEAWIRGFGFASMIEYGLIEKTEPMFLKKNKVDELVTVNSITANSYEDQITFNFSGMSVKGVTHIGRLLNLTVAHEMDLIIEIIRTE